MVRTSSVCCTADISTVASCGELWLVVAAVAVAVGALKLSRPPELEAGLLRVWRFAMRLFKDLGGGELSGPQYQKRLDIAFFLIVLELSIV